MIGDQAKRILTFGLILVIALAIGGGFLVWQRLPAPSVEVVGKSTEAADFWPTDTPEPTATKRPEELTNAAEAGLPPGYKPLGSPGGRQIPSIPEITPQAPPTKAPATPGEQPGGGQPVEPGRVLEGVRQAAEQAKDLAERVTGPTPTPRGGILNTGVAAGVPGWVWVVGFILVAIIALVATGIIGVERE